MCHYKAVRTRQAHYATGAAALSGTIVHDWIRGIQDKRRCGFEIVYQDERKRLQGLAADLEQPQRDDTLIMSLVWLMLQLEHGWQVPVTAEPEVGFAITHNLQPCSFDDPSAMFRGIADAVDLSDAGRHLTVWDYKTGYKLPSQTDWLQLEREAFCLMQAYPSVEKATLAYLYVRHSADVVTQRTRGELAWVADDLRRRADDSNAVWEADLQGETPQATVNKFCGWCPVKLGCPAAGHILDTWPPPDAEHGIKLLKSMISELEERVAIQAEAGGPVPLKDGGSWGHRIRSNHRPTADEVIRWARGAGVPNARILEQARFAPEALQVLETIAGRTMPAVDHPATQFRREGA